MWGPWYDLLVAPYAISVVCVGGSALAGVSFRSCSDDDEAAVRTSSGTLPLNNVIAALKLSLRWVNGVPEVLR